MESVSEDRKTGHIPVSIEKLTPQEQDEANFVRKRFKEQFACHYIPDINIIRQKIDSENNSEKKAKLCKRVHALTSQFSHITFEIPNSLEVIQSGTQVNFETVLNHVLLRKHYKFPVVMEKFNISKLEFSTGTFFAHCELRYYGLVPSNDSRLIDELMMRGNSILGKLEDKLLVGNQFDLVVPFNDSDEMFFFAKHFFYYIIYMLLNGCEKESCAFSSILNQIIELLGKMFAGFYDFKEGCHNYSLRSGIDSFEGTRNVYDRCIFSRIRNFNKLHRGFLYSMQVQKDS